MTALMFVIKCYESSKYQRADVTASKRTIKYLFSNEGPFWSAFDLLGLRFEKMHEIFWLDMISYLIKIQDAV